MNNELKFKRSIQLLDTLFSELDSIIADIEHRFDEEKEQHPALTVEIVSYYHKIVKRYQRYYSDFPRGKRSLNEQVDWVRQDIMGFNRQFENPFLGSKKWYQRINAIQSELAQVSRGLKELYD